MTPTEERKQELDELAGRLGFAIGDHALFDQALTHASRVAEAEEDLRDYEALEFLGDAVLGLAVSEHLFHALPDRTPGEYSRMRAGLVNRRSVARVAQFLEIAPAIRLGRGEERSGGRHRTSLLADCLEALIGAVYLDCGWETAHAFVVRVFEQEIEDAQRTDTVWDYKSRLQTHCQAEHIDLPEFVLVRSVGPDHDKEFEIEVRIRGEAAGSGRGPSKKEAEQNAARQALEGEGVSFG